MLRVVYPKNQASGSGNDADTLNAAINGGAFVGNILDDGVPVVSPATALQDGQDLLMKSVAYGTSDLTPFMLAKGTYLASGNKASINEAGGTITMTGLVGMEAGYVGKYIKRFPWSLTSGLYGGYGTELPYELYKILTYISPTSVTIERADFTGADPENYDVGNELTGIRWGIEDPNKFAVPLNFPNQSIDWIDDTLAMAQHTTAIAVTKRINIRGEIDGEGLPKTKVQAYATFEEAEAAVDYYYDDYYYSPFQPYLRRSHFLFSGGATGFSLRDVHFQYGAFAWCHAPGAIDNCRFGESWLGCVVDLDDRFAYPNLLVDPVPNFAAPNAMTINNCTFENCVLCPIEGHGVETKITACKIYGNTMSLPHKDYYLYGYVSLFAALGADKRLEFPPWYTKPTAIDWMTHYQTGLEVSNCVFDMTNDATVESRTGNAMLHIFSGADGHTGDCRVYDNQFIKCPIVAEGETLRFYNGRSFNQYRGNNPSMVNICASQNQFTECCNEIQLWNRYGYIDNVQLTLNKFINSAVTSTYWGTMPAVFTNAYVSISNVNLSGNDYRDSGRQKISESGDVWAGCNLFWDSRDGLVFDVSGYPIGHNARDSVVDWGYNNRIVGLPATEVKPPKGIKKIYPEFVVTKGRSRDMSR